MQQPSRLITFEIQRPGPGEAIARADAAVEALLRSFGWEFDHTAETRWAVSELAMIVFSGGTDEQIARYLREGDRRADLPYAHTDAEYAATAQSIRAAFGAPAV